MMYYFIVNPNAKHGSGLTVWNKIVGVMKKQIVEYEVLMTAQSGDARKFARQLTEKNKDPKIVIVVGGDGTLNEVLDGICLGCEVTLGYIPAGTGNDFARSIGIGRSIIRGINRNLFPKMIKSLDYGIVSYGEQYPRSRRFMVSSGIGFDAAVCQDLLLERNAGCSRRFFWGKFAYIKAGIREFLKVKPTKGYIVLDDERRIEFNNILFISVHVQPYEGGGFKFAPGADCQDGKLRVCVISLKSKLNLIPVMAAALSGRHRGKKGVHLYDCQNLIIHTERALPVHADGESCEAQKDLQLSCVPRKINVICK